MALVRLRDVGPVTFVAASLGCPRSATITLDSEILRAKCGAAISERYQGITALSVEAVVETYDPFSDHHPGDSGVLSIGIPGALSTSGFPDPTSGITITIVGTITNVVRRISRNDLATGTYTIRGESADGITCPIEIATGADEETGGVISDFVRDIVDFKFDGSAITRDDFCPESVEITEATSLIEDSCQGELWPTYVGITGLNATVTATGKGVKHAFDGATAGATCLGRKGRIEVSVATGSGEDCASLIPGKFGHIDRANVTSLSITATHGEIATISLTWTAHGEAGEISDIAKRARFIID